MTYLLKIENDSGTVSVDMTAYNPNFVFQFSNPIITIPTPMDESAITADTKWNVVTMNLNMNTQTIQISFKESATGGIGGSAGVPNFTTPSTFFEKLVVLATTPTKKKLFINHATTVFAHCEIEGYTATVSPGAKDFVEHSLTLVLSSSSV